MISTRSTLSLSFLVLFSALFPGRVAGEDAPAAPTNSVSSPASGFFEDWFARVTRIQAAQPRWVTPMTTVTPRLEEEYRYDQSWETTSSRSHLTSFGGGKGLELIPFDNIEVILGVPAWQSRNKPAGTDGFADESFLLKYRILSANEREGDYILTAFLGLQTPTGSKGNTTDHYAVTPTIAGGKGFGDFDVQSTLGVGLPDNGSAPSGAGTPLIMNTAFQYQIVRVIWPEVEFDYTYWGNGEHAGLNQLFVTPGLVIGRLPIWERLGMTVGVGYQIALTDKPAYNHNLVVSVRFPF